MTKVALLGFPPGIKQYASRIAATLNESFPETVNVFGTIRSATQFVVAKDPATNKLVGNGNHIYIFAGHVPEEIEMAQNKLASRAGLQIHILSDFEEGRTDDEIRHWLSHGVWPVVQPEPTEIELLDDLFGDSPVESTSSVSNIASIQTTYAIQSERPNLIGVRPPNVSGSISYEPETDELANSAQADDDIPLPGQFPDPVQQTSSESAHSAIPVGQATPIQQVQPDPVQHIDVSVEQTFPASIQYVMPPELISQQPQIENDFDAQTPAQYVHQPVKQIPIQQELRNSYQDDATSLVTEEDTPLPALAPVTDQPVQNLHETIPVQQNVPVPENQSLRALEVIDAPGQGLNLDHALNTESGATSVTEEGNNKPVAIPFVPQQDLPVVESFQAPKMQDSFIQEPVQQYIEPQPIQAQQQYEPTTAPPPVQQGFFGVPIQQNVPVYDERNPYRENRYDSEAYRRQQYDLQQAQQENQENPVVQHQASPQQQYIEQQSEYVNPDYSNSYQEHDYPQQQYVEQSNTSQYKYSQQELSEENLAPLSVTPDQVRQASPGLVNSTFIPAPEIPVAYPDRPESPVRQDSELITKTAIEYLQPAEQKVQTILEEQLHTFAQTPAATDLLPGVVNGRVIYVTGSHGGAGKTTVSYMLANVISRALAQEQGNTEEVFFIEGDYRNSKLAERLGTKSGNDSGRMAAFLQQLNSNQGAAIPNLDRIRANVIQECVIKLPSGLNVVTAPYDSTKRDTRFIQMAIQQIVQYAKDNGAYVFIDADTLSSDDILDRKLVTMADKVVMVTDAGHISDLQRAANTLIKPTAQGGLGVPISRVNVFLNRTGHQTFKEITESGKLNPLSVNGFIPSISEWDTKWVGDQERGANFANAVAKFAIFMNSLIPTPALKKWESHRIVAQKRSGFSFFKKKPKVA